jgi:hypothetical protein
MMAVPTLAKTAFFLRFRSKEVCNHGSGVLVCAALKIGWREGFASYLFMKLEATWSDIQRFVTSHW